MVEVTRQLGPLAEQVGKLSNNVERLYNSNGGPPGYLQTARAEDNQRFTRIFETLDEHKDAIQPLKDFISKHETAAQTREEDHEKLSKRLNTRLAIFTVIILAAQSFGPSLQGCKRIAQTLMAPDAHSQLQQNAIIPNTR